MKLTRTTLLALAFITTSIGQGAAEDSIQNITIKGRITNLKDTGLTSKDSIRLLGMVKDKENPGTSRSRDSDCSTSIGTGMFSLHATKLLPGEYYITTTGMCMLSQSLTSVLKVNIKPNTASGAVFDLGDLVVMGGHTPCNR
jgi:hypothetical protein